jgi:hypothetical protein
MEDLGDLSLPLETTERKDRMEGTGKRLHQTVTRLFAAVGDCEQGTATLTGH